MWDVIDIDAYIRALDWTNLTQEEINRYSIFTVKVLNIIELPKDALMCLNRTCCVQHYGNELCATYDNILSALYASSKCLCEYKSEVHSIKSGWNDFVAKQHAAAREAFKLWIRQT